MKFIKYVILSIILLLAVSQTYAITIDNVNIDVGQTKYRVSSGDVININSILVYANNSNPNSTRNYKVELYFQNDEDQDYFTIRKSVYTGELCNNNINNNCTENILFKVYAKDNMPADQYKLYLELTVNGNSQRIPITIYVDEYNDNFDVKLEDNTFCSTDAVYRTNLIIYNDSSSDYYFTPKIDATEFWPKIRDDEVKVVKNSQRKVYVEFLKTQTIGEYTINFESTYKKANSNTEEVFNKKLNINVVDCLIDDIQINVRNQILNTKIGDRSIINYELINNSQNNINVYFGYESEDPSIIITQQISNVNVRANSKVLNTIYVTPTNNASIGNKKITLYATTSNSNVKADINVNVINGGLDIRYNEINTKLGSKGYSEITFTNYSNSSISLILDINSKYSDIIYFNNKILNLNPNESKNVGLNIIPNTQGEKMITILISGNVSKTKDIFYSVKGTENKPTFVNNYTNKINVSRNSQSNIPVLLVNRYNYPIKIKIGLETNLNFVIIPQEITLMPNTETTANILFNVGNTTPNIYEISLIEESELGINKYPIVLGIETDPNTGNIDILDLPNPITYKPNTENIFTFKIKNNNNYIVSNATIMVYANNQLISTKSFSINGLETKNISINATMGNSTITGKIIINSNNNQYIKDITFVEDKSIITTGLFGLGFANTLGIVLGLIILILLLLFTFTKNNTLKAKGLNLRI